MEIRMATQIHTIGSHRRALIAPVRDAVRSAAAAASPTLRQQTSSRRWLAQVARLELLKMADPIHSSPPPINHDAALNDKLVPAEQALSPQPGQLHPGDAWR
jgi:hypothetical protein